MIPVAILGFGVLALGCYYAYFAFREGRQLRPWSALVAGIQPLDMPQMERLAMSYLNPGKDQLGIEPAEMWALIGGYEGLNRMRGNAEAMLELARHVQRWNPTEGRVVAEMMRRDAVRLRTATRKIEMATLTQRYAALAPFSVQEASAAYYLMRQRLLALYESNHAGLRPQLASVL